MTQRVRLHAVPPTLTLDQARDRLDRWQPEGDAGDEARALLGHVSEVSEPAAPTADLVLHAALLVIVAALYALAAWWTRGGLTWDLESPDPRPLLLVIGGVVIGSAVATARQRGGGSERF